MTLFTPVDVNSSTVSWTIAANAEILSGSSGKIPTFPGEDILPRRGVVMPTTPIFLPDGVVIIVLLLILFGIVLVSCPASTTRSARLLSRLKSKFALRNGNAVPTYPLPSFRINPPSVAVPASNSWLPSADAINPIALSSKISARPDPSRPKTSRRLRSLPAAKNGPGI